MEENNGKEKIKEKLENGIAKEDTNQDVKKELEEIKSPNFSLVNIEITTSNKKIFLVIIIALVVMTVSSFSAIFVMNSSKEKKEEDLSKVEIEIEQEEKEMSLKLPVYSEDAKKRMADIYKQDDGEKVAYLTFDDGPSNNITPQILEILKNEDVKATFFILGSRAEIYPELVKREYEEEHYIANHGYSHVYTSIYSDKQAVLEEYNRTEKIIKNAIENEEYSSHLFRFPGGSEGGKYKKVKNEAKNLLKENGIEFINWNALTNDAVGKPTYESLVSDLLKTSDRKK